MSLIQEPASYRGVVVEHAVGATSTGLPQFVAKLRALERYDFDEKVWIDWTPRDDCEITAYLVMFTAEQKEIFHVKDIQNVFEWDGKDIIALDGLDLEGAEVQFEVISEVYKEKPQIKVARIGKFDDAPGSGAVKKLDAAELVALNAKFSAGLKKSGGGPKAASAKTGKTATTAKTPATPPPAPPAKTEEQASTDAAATVPDPVYEKSAKTTKSTPPPAPCKPVAPPAPPKAPAAKTEAVVKKGRELTYETAWAECYDGKLKTVTNEQLATAFTAAMHRIASGQSEGEISPEDWGKIADTVLGECGGS